MVVARHSNCGAIARIENVVRIKDIDGGKGMCQERRSGLYAACRQRASV